MTRLCRHCGDAARNTRGPAVCQACWLANGDAAREKASKNRRSKKVTCTRCDVEYFTRSGNRTCPKCLHHASKHPCADCGIQVDKRAAVCRQCWGARHTGENSPSFKRGKSIATHSGYVLVPAPGHPRAGKSNNYVREHVLVMEAALGRYLLPGESVHHRNGIKTDNRLENLELWVVGQPAGQRVEEIADWAEEVLRRYRPHLLRSPLTSASLEVT